MNGQAAENKLKEKVRALPASIGQGINLYLDCQNFSSFSPGRSEIADKLTGHILSLGQDPGQVFNKGFRKAFETIHGSQAASWVGEAVARLPLYAYSPSSYRRSFRSADMAVNLDRFLYLLDTILFPWADYDLARELSAPGSAEPKAGYPLLAKRRHGWDIFGDFLAVRLDQGDQAIIGTIRDIMVGDNNAALLSQPVICGIAKSAQPELVKLLVDLLLAAKLQEGLRQSILETVDTGRIENLITFMKVIKDNDLFRYSSVIRAVDVWMGLGWTAGDRRVTAKIMDLGLTCLTDPKARQAAAKSRDVTEIYAALWAVSARDTGGLGPLIDNLLKGQKYQKLAAMAFVSQLDKTETQLDLASRELEKWSSKPPIYEDLEFVAAVVGNYRLDRQCFMQKSRLNFRTACQKHAALADPKVRQKHVAAFLRILPLVPENGFKKESCPFPWNFVSLGAAEIFKSLLILAGYGYETDFIDQIAEVLGRADSVSRLCFVRFFLDEPGSQKQRDSLLACLSDKSLPVRAQALKNLLALELTPEETEAVFDSLALKTGEIRQTGVRILLGLPGQGPLEAAQRLLGDKDENKRLAGLDLLSELLKTGRIHKKDVPGFLSLMPKVTEQEAVLAQALTAERPRYTNDNGFGLYDPDYVPVFPKLTYDPKHRAGQVFAPCIRRLKTIFMAMIDLIRTHREYTYKIRTFSGDVDRALGALTEPAPRAEVKGLPNITPIDAFVLQEVWRKWLKEHKVTVAEIFYFGFARFIGMFNFNRSFNYQPWLSPITEKFFRSKDASDFFQWCGQQEYAQLALKIVSDLMPDEFPEGERIRLAEGLLAELVAKVSPEDWTRPIYDANKTPYWLSGQETYTLSEAWEVKYLISSLRKNGRSDEGFARLVAACFELGALSGRFYIGLYVSEAARAVTADLLKPDALFRALLMSEPHFLGQYSGKIRLKHAKEAAEKYPILNKTANLVAARVIEMELLRGDTRTEVSHLAAAITWHEGAKTLADILIALGKETFVRGYCNWQYQNSPYTKKDVLSALLKSCRPGPDDTAETLRAALGGRISDKRLIEASMYSPSWLDITGDCLGWPGLKSAAWFFHAHINQSFSAEKETEVARFSPIPAHEFNDGAFDVGWFWEAYKTIGAERFEQLYDSAKYITDGGNHRRAQLFADAALGRLAADDLAKEVHDKRNKDKLLAYSIVPMDPKDLGEALKRYRFISGFLKESKSFGAQRRESESKVGAIAIENLARNAGFSDGLIFAWRMETMELQNLKVFLEPQAIGDYTVRVFLTEDGQASLECSKGGKVLASVPAALKKAAHVTECRNAVNALKEQRRRTQEKLEEVMVNRYVFGFGDAKNLMEHPVVAPLLKKLVLVSLNDDGCPQKSGFYGDLKGLEDKSPIRVAHPYDLFILGTWLDLQRLAYRRKLVQPFKQIFRELYPINDDEKEARTASRRYAGHQVQPKKTLALLRGRGWTVDYETGLQRVYYRENLIVKLYAAADWFSPADTEEPTLETVEFLDRKTLQPVNLEKIDPVIFSEVMRDIDLVVSVAHTGSVDPEASHSTVEMRAAIIRELMDLLKIKNVIVTGRMAAIKGHLGDYTVHLGSAQVHKIGRGAVNILAIPSQHRGRVFLPFADDDPRTAELMSKIILLSDDRAIKDPAILEQIG
jgi:hypothetical protein